MKTVFRFSAICSILLLAALPALTQDSASALFSRAYLVDGGTELSFTSTALAARTSRAGRETNSQCPVRYSVVQQNLYFHIESDLQAGEVKLPRGKYLAVFGDDLLLLYTEDGREPALIAGDGDLKTVSDYFPASATSELTEAGRVYSADGLDKLLLGNPWAEGVKGPGLGQAIALEQPAGQAVVDAIKVYIVNGYVSFDRPDLFLKNNRVKTLEVFDGDRSLGELNLADSARLQTFNLEISGRSPLRFVIRAVYPGMRFDDTCLTLLYAAVTRQHVEGMPDPGL